MSIDGITETLITEAKRHETAAMMLEEGLIKCDHLHIARQLRLAAAILSKSQ